VPRGQRDGSLRPYSRLSRPEPLRFLSSSSSIVFKRLGLHYTVFISDIVKDPLHLNELRKEALGQEVYVTKDSIFFFVFQNFFDIVV
jgi:hypothetical protein